MFEKNVELKFKQFNKIYFLEKINDFFIIQINILSINLINCNRE